MRNFGRSESSDEPLLAPLRRTLTDWAAEPPTRLTVAFSGGLDSTVLLAALVRLQWRAPLRAVYVDHGIHAESAQWGEQCAQVASALGVEFATAAVTVDRASGSGLEAAARDVRYAALANLLVPGEWLLTAHHADDQLETVLLRLLRGTGVRGLRGIIPFGRFARGFLARPLLPFTRAELHAQALRWGLRWLEDPSNRDPRHDRSFLRERVLPQLVGRWPAAASHATRLAAQMGEAEELLEAVGAGDALDLPLPGCLPRARLEALSLARQRNLLRHLLRRAGLAVPSARKIEELRVALLGARADAQPLVRWPGGEGRVYRGCLYLLAPAAPASTADPVGVLRVGRSWSGPEGVVALEPAGERPGLPQSWVDAGLTLRFRGGGERFRPFGRRHHLSLKNLFQERGIVPWMRSRVPLLFHGPELVAVGDEWITADVETVPASEPRWRVTWSAHPPAAAPDKA
jgi:tRNA(Ile)-lysidine synthase